MIRAKLLDIVGNIESLKALQEIKLPVKISYRIMKLTKKFQAELESYEIKRNQLVKEFGEVGKDGNIKVTDPKKLTEFTSQLQELLSSECDIEGEKIKIAELGDINIESKLLLDIIFE